ncbi:FliH/SctL family protein [Lacimonas salitolerans]|uniref:FliH/SctL family protein n=1 Tax=Lacimonas salitolerans TaxID=1323750 RepID=A0ABW4EDZ0_9RHOB
MFYSTSDLKASTEKDGYVRANVADVLQGLQGRGFAKDGDMPRKAGGSFRHLTWSDLAVELPVEPDPAPEDHEPDISHGTDTADTSKHSDTAGADVPAAGPNDGPPTEIDDPSHTAPDVPVPAEPPAPAVDEQMLQKIRDDAYAEGLSAGKAMTESEREAELAQQFDRLRDLIERLDATDVLDIATLSKSLKRAVLDLASQRVGLLLTEMPDILVERIETLVQNLSHLSGQRELFLAPEDVPLVQGRFVKRQHSPQLHIIADSALRRGDARLRIGGAEMSDLMSETEKAAAKPEAETV